MNNKEIHVYFSDGASATSMNLQKKALEQITKGIENSFEIQLLRAIKREIENLKKNPQKGIPIKKDHVLKITQRMYGTNKLWKLNLVGFWRVIYALIGDQTKIIVFVLEIMSHKEYDKRFGYGR